MTTPARTCLTFTNMLRYLWIPCLAAASLLACGGEETAADGDAVAANDAAGEAHSGPDGARIYKTRCVACHGSKGNMGANGAANLQASVIPLNERIATVTHGRMDKGMNAFKGILSPDEIRAVSEYTLTLKK